jgi:hypothetical protein
MVPATNSATPSGSHHHVVTAMPVATSMPSVPLQMGCRTSLYGPDVTSSWPFSETAGAPGARPLATVSRPAAWP